MSETDTPAAAEQPAAIPAAETPAAAQTLLGGDTPAAAAADPAKAAAPAQGEKPAKDGEEKPADGDKKADPITPESYGDFTLPEGVTPDDAVMDAFKSLAAENGLSQEAAQKFVDLQAQLNQKQQQSIVGITQQWAKDARADTEFGGAAFDRNVGLAQQALSAFGSPALTDLINQTGLGNHPEIIRAFYRIGKAMSEDGRVVAGAGPQGDRLAALYPTMAGG